MVGDLNCFEEKELEIKTSSPVPQTHNTTLRTQIQVGAVLHLCLV